ncbi:BTB/POZ domain-containing protein [Glomus cerebriforme]|uniref:BTB/POZ domain-containing protein n=1 Tax=Glomus cerebriforme TaxID=658196 RepID=A0A397TKD6_9GLOM|nr:BTB/POZ domain-containing protein [Glomus cerebriforme]
MLLSWKPISCDFTSGLSLYWSYNKSDSILDLSSFVKGEYGFILRVQLLGNLSWDRLQLFRQEMDKAEPLIDDDESFGMDVRVELEPNIICKELPKNIFNEKEIVLNDQNTSDFTIILNDSKENQVAYHVHKFILEYYSEYFKGLFSSQMREATDKTLTLSEISVHSFENILNFMYTGQVKDDLNDLEQWTDLLYGASRFIIPILIQECEKSISKYVNNDNVEEIEGIANDCGAEQLFRYCQMLETENSDALYLLKI